MITLKIIWYKTMEVFWGCVSKLSWRLAQLFKPDYEKLEKILKDKDKYQ